MVSRCDFFHMPSNVSSETFRAALCSAAAEAAKAMPGLRKYQLNFVVSKAQNADLGRGEIDIDAYSEMYFDSVYDMNENIRNLNHDLANRVLSDTGVMNIRKEDTPIPAPYQEKNLMKRMSFLACKEGVSIERFKHEWWGKHSVIMKYAPGYLSYTQNLVIDRFLGGKQVGYAQLPVIGMVELYFTDQTAWDAFYSSPSMDDLRAHHGTFIGTITNFNVEPVTVIEQH